jgi:hypothetical protein
MESKVMNFSKASLSVVFVCATALGCSAEKSSNGSQAPLPEEAVWKGPTESLAKAGENRCRTQWFDSWSCRKSQQHGGYVWLRYGEKVCDGRIEASFYSLKPDDAVEYC